MDNYTLNQAQQQLEQIQNYQQQIAGQPVRVYPFKIVSGLNYLSNRGLSDIGTNPGSSFVDSSQTMSNSIPYGAYTDLSLIYSGNKPIICYWFGVVNATMNSDGTVSETINATQDENGNWVPNQFSNPLTAKTIDSTKVGLEKWGDMEVQNPWKEVGVIDFAITPSETRKEQLDNVDVGVYSTVYNFSTFSNTWYPSYQEINEFVYFIVDSRYACPIALRITSLTPHFRPDGVFQYCDIQFQSVNQYFNTTSRSILTYIKFGAPNDAYAFPQEIIENGEIKTIINPNFLLPSQGGVDSVCIKNNSLVAHLGTLIYGHPYIPFQAKDGVLTRTNANDRYLIPLLFEAPINDNIVSQHSLVHSSYSLAMNMVIISEQLWGSWRQTKEIYNPIQNFTFQGGLAFAGTLDQGSYNGVLYNSISNILNPENEPTLKDQIWQNTSPNQGGYYSWGSCNIQNVMFTNKKNWTLDILQVQAWQPLGTNITGTGFFVYSNQNSLATWDFRGTGLCAGMTAYQFEQWSTGNAEIADIADIFCNGYTPSTSNSEVDFLVALTNGYQLYGNFVAPNIAYTLNSMSLLKTHLLEINYRDGIVYTNTNRGHGGFLNMIANWMSGIADKFLGYTPGEAQFFMNTASRTYNLFIPSSLLPLFQQYLDPNGSNYNAVPLDIFNNSYDNNTAVGQLQYMSGLQFSLTDTYQPAISTSTNSTYTTEYWGKWEKSGTEWVFYTTNTNNCTIPGGSLGDAYYFPQNSFMNFGTPCANLYGYSFVIDEINVKELGQSNLHISYLKNTNNKLNIVGEEWVANNAKVMKNNAFIENDFDYYVYDEYNTTFASNVSPFLSLQYSPLPSIISTTKLPMYTLPKGASRGCYNLLPNATIQGVSFTTNTTHWQKGQISYNSSLTYTFPPNSDYLGDQGFDVSNGQSCGAEFVYGWSCPIGSWYTSPWVWGGNWGSNASYLSQLATTPTQYNNNSYLTQITNASTTITDNYLQGTELISNCLFTNFSCIGNQSSGAPTGWGQLCSLGDCVYYETIHLVFNINYLITTTAEMWEYSPNSNYQNIYCLVPEKLTAKEINDIPLPQTFPSNSRFVLIYDGTKTHILSYGETSPVVQFDGYGYLQNSFPSNTVLTNPDPHGPYGPKSANDIGLFNTWTYLNGGGCVNLITIPQPGLSSSNPVWNYVSITDSGNNNYNSSDNVLDTSAYQIQLWSVKSNNTFPDSPTTKYGGKKYKLVMIVLK